MNKQINISGVVLKTKRLTLRPWRLSDLQDFYEYASVDGVGQMAGWNPHQNIEESKKILEMFIRDKKTLALEYQGKLELKNMKKKTIRNWILYREGK